MMISSISFHCQIIGLLVIGTGVWGCESDSSARETPVDIDDEHHATPNSDSRVFTDAAKFNDMGCPTGFEPGLNGCVDVDECLTDNGECAHVCVNEDGGFTCACDEGYSIDSDGRNCTPDGPCPGCTFCSDPEWVADQIDTARQHWNVLATGVPEYPSDISVPEDTNGTLKVDIHPDAFPVMAGPEGVFVAASTIGAGRVVAFSGQDFLSSGLRSTLLGEDGIRRLISNSANWVRDDLALADTRILAANGVVADRLREAGAQRVEVVPVRFSRGLEEPRDWSAERLSNADVAVVQVNEWGTLHLAEVDVPNLRAFIENGGGLLVAGSALHWSWWLDWTAETNQGDALLDGSGLSWTPNTIRSIDSGRVSFDPMSVPSALWCAYVVGSELTSEHFARLPPLFMAAETDDRHRELDIALTRLVDETPALPVSRMNSSARLAATVGAELVGYDWPVGHAWRDTFPGAPDPNAEPGTQTITVDARWKKIQPLGVYAPPGASVTVRLDPEHVAQGVSVQLGERYDDLRFLDHIDAWQRPPILLQTVPLDRDAVNVGNAFGGSLYLKVPVDYPDVDLEVTVDGGLTQAVFIDGETSMDTFETALSAGAPMAILQSRGAIRLVVHSSAVRQANATPTEILNFWREFHESHAALSSEPTPRNYESHWLFDEQVGWGYANATSARINYPILATDWALRTRVGDEDWWLFAHELGHQFQTSDWSGGDITEVAVNLFSMYTINHYLNDGGDFETRGFKENRIDHAALREARWPTADLFGKLELYRQLVFEFGWPIMQAVFASYYDPAYPRNIYGGFMDGFALRFSALAERDITPFLDRWEFPYTDAARERIQGMGLTPWLPPGWAEN